LNLVLLRNGLVAAFSLVTVLALAAPAHAGTVTAGETSGESCIEGKRTDAAVGSETVEAPGVSFVRATLTGAEGNWDLAVIDETGRVVASSAFADSQEIAEGFAIAPGELYVQACRRSGGDETAEIDVEVEELTEEASRLQLVSVSTPTDDEADRLASHGFDLTEHGDAGHLDVVLHNPAEGAMLNDLGFSYEVIEPDLAAASVADRQAESRLAARGAPTAFPSGRTGTYRELADYSTEMQQLAADNPGLVRYFTLKKETYSGRKVEAIEVAPNVKRKDGRPVFVMTGVHHAREWPSSEHTLEFAYDLIQSYRNGSQRIRGFLSRARVIFVPVVNPDGFNLSRTAGAALGASGGRDAPAGDETANLVIEREYHRKNCRYLQETGLKGGDCNQQPDNGIAHFGVDPNRNYGGFWGGPGAASGDEAPLFDTAADYRGPGPFSEPETRNIRRLVSTRQVTTLITNHTFSNLVLHPPGLQAQGKPRDDTALRRLADSMAEENGYSSQAGFELYDTSGTTEDWSYNATSGFGYTFEIGPNAFHPTYQTVVDEYRGNTEAAGGGGGNRGAYLKALRHTTKAKNHSLIRGKAPAGSLLELTKRFKTPTSPVLDGNGEEGEVILIPEKLHSSLRVDDNGEFDWHVNPSTRPIVDPRVEQLAPRPGQPSDPVTFSGSPGPDAIPCADADSEDPSCYNDHPFEVLAGPGIDNGTANVKITWPSPTTDWDMKVFRDSNGDGLSDGENKQVGASANGISTDEETTVARPGLKPGDYVVRVTNFAAAEPYDGTVTFGKTQAGVIETGFESYTLTCRKGENGPILSTQKIEIKRSETKSVNLNKTCKK
jgi:hypothetical protein